MPTEWNRLVHEHGPAVYGTAWRILRHAADTEDVVQEVFLEANRVRQEHTVHNWGGVLRKLASYRALDRLRQRRASVPLNGQVLCTSSNDGPEAIAIGNELAERLTAAIGLLPEREATVFCLRFFDDLSYQQIAETLDITAGAVAAALHKARGRLETMLLPDQSKETCCERAATSVGSTAG